MVSTNNIILPNYNMRLQSLSLFGLSQQKTLLSVPQFWSQVQYFRKDSINYRRVRHSGGKRIKSPKPLKHADFSKFDAMELVLCLNNKERQYLINALQKFDSYQIKKEYEDKMACSRWRTRIGWRRRNKLFRPDEIDNFVISVPEYWLEKRKNQHGPTKPPTLRQLCHLLISNALPFVAFGFLDNSIMILMGESIEMNIKAVFVISTMAAAALGNTISDVVGLWTTHYVERGIEFMGFQPPALSPYQISMPISRRFTNGGRLIGITVGCLLGMLPLLFFDETKKEKG